MATGFKCLPQAQEYFEYMGEKFPDSWKEAESLTARVKIHQIKPNLGGVRGRGGKMDFTSSISWVRAVGSEMEFFFFLGPWSLGSSDWGDLEAM